MLAQNHSRRAAAINVKLARDEANADLVVMMVSSPSKTEVTGVAYLQKFDCANFLEGGEEELGCNRGLNYRDFAFSVVSIESATSGLVFAHEVGHQLGMEHNKERFGSNPTYQFSFGYYDCLAFRETIISKAGQAGLGGECPSAPFQQLQFSNPFVPFIGTDPPVVSGDCRSYNALAAQLLSRDTSELFSPINPLNDWDFDSGFDEIQNSAPPICQ